MARLSLVVVSILIAGFVGGCVESKPASFNACYDEYVGYFLKPRPQGRPPDDYLLRSLAFCMRRKGYVVVTAPEGSCASPRDVTADCFHALWFSIIRSAVFE
jgi:hypothetical protein